MARAQWASEEVYSAASRFVDEALRSDGSLFVPGRAVWTAENVNELYRRFVEAPDLGDRDFTEKLHDQLGGAERAVIQLAAEILYLHYLGDDMTGQTKRERLGSVLAWHPEPLVLPEELDGALDSGIANIAWARIRIDAQISFMLEFAKGWKELPAEAVTRLLGDPWEFRAFVDSLQKHSASSAIEAIPHLVFPESFEPIFSWRIKDKIGHAYEGYVENEEAPLDQKVYAIRQALEAEHGGAFSFYDEPFASEWKAETGKVVVGGWIVRGERAYGTNLVPRWLDEGFVSIGDTPEGEVKAGMTTTQIMDLVSEQLADRTRQSLGGHANAGRQFASEIAIGDWVMTRDGPDVYAGRITSEQTWHPDAEPGTARRRSVDWLNSDDPLTWNELPEPLRKRAATRPTVWNLKDQAAVLAALFEEAGGSAWSEYLGWAAKIYAVSDFDLEERDYKLEVAERMREARRLCEAGDDSWLPALRRAFGPPNNMTAWRANDDLLTWSSANPEQARALLVRLWSDPDDISATLADWPVQTSAGNKVALVSLLLLAVDAARFPVFRSTVLRRTLALLDLSSRIRVTTRESAGAELAAWYDDFVGILREMVEKLSERGTELRDLMDAQSIAWWLASVGPPAEWSEEEQMAFHEWRGDTLEGDPPPPAGIDMPEVTEGVAGSLHVPREWLQEIVDLLNERRQVVFYGPPGTGKTLIAQRLGELAAVAGGSFELIQFHPAYSYEDFFEGFRPQAVETGTGVSYALRHGPLRRAATRAIAEPTKPHVLVIDELNRGNVAKIFGELFFLLEYRDRAIPLQYSPEEHFALPKNLFFIGTMNTADRSIALVDSALRRRFYFVPFLPTEPPLVRVLEKWLTAEGLDAEPALILRRLNEAIGAQEFSIGPSYFMAARGPNGIDLDRVWRFAIKPLLEEHYYGTGRSVDEFSFGVLARQQDDVQLEEAAAEDDEP